MRTWARLASGVKRRGSARRTQRNDVSTPPPQWHSRQILWGAPNWTSTAMKRSQRLGRLRCEDDTSSIMFHPVPNKHCCPMCICIFQKINRTTTEYQVVMSGFSSIGEPKKTKPNGLATVQGRERSGKAHPSPASSHAESP